MEEILLYFAIKYNGDWNKIYEAIKTKESVNDEDLKEVILNNKEEYITIISDKYPDCLKSISKPPFVLFYKGNIDLIYDKRLKIAVIGSRENTEYGKTMCESLVKDLSNKNVTIISGFARGIDSIAHTEALKNKGSTIAVFGCGINECYPKENKELYSSILENNGLLISEYPSNTKVEKENFPTRNRIIAAFSHGILVIEAKHRSGTMITVKEGLEYGKDIFCVPQCANIESGCNSLIKGGAKLVTSVNDILDEYTYIN